MSHTRHLPIWKAALDLAVHLEHAVRRFPRYHKYTLGTVQTAPTGIDLATTRRTFVFKRRTQRDLTQSHDVFLPHPVLLLAY